MDKNGRVIVDPITRETSLPNIYAGGDCVNGGKEVINAVEDGREAAFAMLRSWGMETKPTMEFNSKKIPQEVGNGRSIHQHMWNYKS